MAVKTYTIANFSQSSTWTVGEYPAWDPDAFKKYLVSGPSLSTQSKSVTFSGIPTGSTINSATLTATVGSTNYTLRTLDDAFFNGSRNVKPKVTAGGSASFVFKFQGSGSTASVGTFRSTLEYSNIKITVDYTEPASKLTLNKTTMKAGDTIRATITPASSTSTHKVKFSMTGVTTVTSATIPAGTKTYDYTVPLAWQNAMPNNASRTVTVTLQTYSGATMTGDVDKTFTLTLSDDAYPTITQFDLTRIPGFVDEDITGYIQGFSQAQVQSAATGAYSSTISQYKVTVGAWSNTGADVTTPVFAESGTKTVVLEVTDSRGRKATDTKSFAVIPYQVPSLLTPSVFRSDALGVEAVAGTNVQIKTGVKVSALGDPDVNAGVLKARVYKKGTTAPAWDAAGIVTLTANTASIVSGADIATSYTIDIQASDKLASYVYTAEISTAKALISGLAEVAGVAIGKYAETTGVLDIGLPRAIVNGNPVCTIEIGQLYIHTDSTSPADKFPGTSWLKLPEGTFIMAGGATYVPGEASGEGGAAEHTHNEGNLAAHLGGKSGESYIYWKNQSTAFTSTYRIATAAAISSNSSSISGSIDVTGNTGSASSLPPFRAYHIWERTA